MAFSTRSTFGASDDSLTVPAPVVGGPSLPSNVIQFPQQVLQQTGGVGSPTVSTIPGVAADPDGAEFVKVAQQAGPVQSAPVAASQPKSMLWQHIGLAVGGFVVGAYTTVIWQQKRDQQADWR